MRKRGKKYTLAENEASSYNMYWKGKHKVMQTIGRKIEKRGKGNY